MCAVDYQHARQLYVGALHETGQYEPIPKLKWKRSFCVLPTFEHSSGVWYHKVVWVAYVATDVANTADSTAMVAIRAIISNSL
jgi:hypothetical protein